MSRRTKRDQRDRSRYHRQLLLEQLEDRRMLSWLTVISHGNDSSPDEMQHITDAIESRYEAIGQPLDQDAKELKILPGASVTETLEVFKKVFGTTNPLPDVDRIIQVDWSETAKGIFGGDGNGMADSIGGRLGLILGMLVNRQTNVEGIHLIGHSRGAFVVSTAAAVLNGGTNSDLALLYADDTQQVVTAFKQQQAVDRPAVLHVTTLDPNPMPWPSTLLTNVCVSYDASQKAKSFLDGVHCKNHWGTSDGVLISAGVNLWENYYREATTPIGGKGFLAARISSIPYGGVDYKGVNFKLQNEYLNDHWNDVGGDRGDLGFDVGNDAHSAVHRWYAESIHADSKSYVADKHISHKRWLGIDPNRWEYRSWGIFLKTAVEEKYRPELLEIVQVSASASSQPANINLEVAEITDTSGTANSSNPGLLKRSFLPGDTVRITLKADNTGAAAPILVTADVGLYRDHTIYSRSSTNDTPLQTNELDYYSFDWAIPANTVAGEYGILAAIQSPDSVALYDTTAPGRDDTWSTESWRPHQFRVLDPTPAATNSDIQVQVGSQQIVDGQTDSVPFGSVDQGLHGEVQTFNVSNHGSGDLALGTLTLPDGYQFLEGLDAELRPGESDSFTVVLDTSNGGQYSGNVQIASNDPDEAQFSFPLSGQVLPRPTGDPEIAVEFIARPIQAGSTVPVFFGSRKQGDPSISYSFTVHNVGSSALTLGPVEVTGGFHVTDSLASTLAAGESDYLTILFDSTSTGFREGVVSIVSNDSDESPFVFLVSGEVRAACTEAPALSSVRTDVSAVTQPETISIDATASNAVTRVEFYRDINRNGVGEPEEYLGEDRVYGRDGWRLENISTAGWSHTGPTTIMAIGYDDCGNSSPWEDRAAADMTVRPGPASPQLGALSPNSNWVVPPGTISIDSSVVSGAINRVQFYRDLDKDGFGDSDEFLGVDHDGSDGWQLTGVATDAWEPETTSRLLAVATDSKGWTSNTSPAVIRIWSSPPTGGDLLSLGAEFVVPGNASGAEQTFSTHSSEGIANDPWGNSIVTWVRGGDIYARLFHADGTPMSDDITVNTSMADNQDQPAVAMSERGEFVVVWTSERRGVFGQRFDSSGNAKGGEFLINSGEIEGKAEPSVAIATDGGFTVAWKGKDADAHGIFSQRFDSLGNRVGIETRLNQSEVGDQHDPSIGMANDGSYVVSWTDRDLAADKSTVRATRFLPDGGTRLVALAETAGFAYSSIAMKPDGEFVVVSSHRNTAASVRVDSFSADGVLRWSNNTQATDAWNSSVAIDPMGYTIVTWGSNGKDCQICGQMYDPAGSRLGGVVSLNSSENGSQRSHPSVALNQYGEIIVSWTGPGTSNDVLARRYRVPFVVPYQPTEDTVFDRDKGDGLAVRVTDIAAEDLTFSLVTAPRHGQVVLNPDGSFQYTPEANFNRMDSFVYRVHDGSVERELGLATLQIDTAYPWFNYLRPRDVNDDSVVTPLDALWIINVLNDTGSQQLASSRAAGVVAPYLDVNRDGFSSPVDALLVIDDLNHPAGGEAMEGEAIGTVESQISNPLQALWVDQLLTHEDSLGTGANSLQTSAADRITELRISATGQSSYPQAVDDAMRTPTWVLRRLLSGSGGQHDDLSELADLIEYLAADIRSGEL